MGITWDEKAEQLRQHGFDEKGIEAFRVTEETIKARQAAKKKAPKQAPAALDFGDWDL